jgi:nuclear pore complex protein Nup205
MITIPRNEDRAARFIGELWCYCISHGRSFLAATVPTVGDTIEALTDLCDDLVETLKQITTISTELDARDHVQVEDIRQVGYATLSRSNIKYSLLIQIITLQDTDTLGDLDIGQKRALVCRELERMLGPTRTMTDTLLCEPVPFSVAPSS